MSNNIRPGTKLIKALSDIITAHPGISSVDISAQSGYSLSHVKRSLCELSRTGLVVPIRMCGKEGAGWFEATKVEDARRINSRSSATVVRQALEVICLKPGASARDIAAVIGRSRSYTAWALTTLSTQGVAKPVRIGNRMDGWFTAEIAAEKIATAENAKREKLARREDRKVNPPMTNMRRIIEQANGYEGASYAMVASELHLPAPSISASIYKLQRRGELFKAERPGCRARWFDTPERAAAWAAMPRVMVSEFNPTRQKDLQHPAKARRLVAIGERLKSKSRQPSKPPPLMKGSTANKPGAEQLPVEKPSKPAGVHIPDKGISFRSREPIMNGVAVQVVSSPKYDIRYQVDPSSIPRFSYSKGGYV